MEKLTQVVLSVMFIALSICAAFCVYDAEYIIKIAVFDIGSWILIAMAVVWVWSVIWPSQKENDINEN